jgi:hypothetical protein
MTFAIDGASTVDSAVDGAVDGMVCDARELICSCQFRRADIHEAFNAFATPSCILLTRKSEHAIDTDPNN